MTKRKLYVVALGIGLSIVLLPGLMPAGLHVAVDPSQYLASGRFGLAAGIVFLGGLLTALTPCVYPLIPITASVFGAGSGSVGSQGRVRSITLSATYVLGMGLVFAGLGLTAAKAGQAFGSVLGSPWVAGALAVLLLLLASSMFGAFDIRLPEPLLRRLSSVQGTGWAGAFLMGGASGFLAAPCTGPVLTGLLTFVAKSQRPALGGGLLFVYALGMGLPFLALGAFALRLPRGGRWMEWVKNGLGVLLLALAASYLKDAIPSFRQPLTHLAMALGPGSGAWLAAGLAAVGIWLGGSGKSFASKAPAVGLVVIALLLRAETLSASAGEPALRWEVTVPEGARTLARFDSALSEARKGGKPVMVDFSAEWCSACKELDRYVYTTPAVVQEADRFVRIKVDSTNEEEGVTALQQRYGIQGLPTVVFISSAGQVLAAPRVLGFLPSDQFLSHLKKVH